MQKRSQCVWAELSIAASCELSQNILRKGELINFWLLLRGACNVFPLPDNLRRSDINAYHRYRSHVRLKHVLEVSKLSFIEYSQQCNQDLDIMLMYKSKCSRFSAIRIDRKVAPWCFPIWLDVYARQVHIGLKKVPSYSAIYLKNS